MLSGALAEKISLFLWSSFPFFYSVSRLDSYFFSSDDKTIFPVDNRISFP
ncbi:hypothetical protein HMPREF1548_03593 [Clostridium sp. KLE 1755]|nr:hypothetical protein HMPREF1548_03593 [Clostridium sp. KLE 1755]